MATVRVFSRSTVTRRHSARRAIGPLALASRGPRAPRKIDVEVVRRRAQNAVISRALRLAVLVLSAAAHADQHRARVVKARLDGFW